MDKCLKHNKCGLLAEANHRIVNHFAIFACHVRLKTAALAGQLTEPCRNEMRLLLEGIGVHIDAARLPLRRNAKEGQAGQKTQCSAVSARQYTRKSSRARLSCAVHFAPNPIERAALLSPYFPPVPSLGLQRPSTASRRERSSVRAKSWSGLGWRAASIPQAHQGCSRLLADLASVARPKPPDRVMLCMFLRMSPG
jgi:hypothetical protein